LANHQPSELFSAIDDARHTYPQLQQLGAEVCLSFQSFLSGET